MRIVHIAPKLGTKATVRDLRTAAMVAALVEKQSETHTAKLVEPKPYGSGGVVAGAIGLAAMRRTLPRMIHAASADIVHIHDRGDAAVVAAWACRRKSVPYALTIADESDFAVRRAEPSSTFGAGWLFGARRLLTGAARLFVLDPRSLDSIREAAAPQVVAPMRLAMLPEAPMAHADVRGHSPFAANAMPKVLMMGLRRGHGQTVIERFFAENLRRLIAELSRSFPRLQVVALCEGLAPRTLRTLADTIAASDHVGFVSLLTVDVDHAQEIDAAYADADLLLVLGQRGLDTRLDVLRAWAAQKPVVAVDADGGLELIDDGRTGRLVPLNDPALLVAATKELLDNERLRDFFAQQGREHIETYYAPADAAQELLASYRKVLA